LNRQANGVALTVGASLIWGTSFVAVSLGLQYSNPYVLLFERFFVASAAILVVGLFSRSARVWSELRKPRTWALAVVYALAFLLQFIGQDASGASASALLSNLFVIFVPVAAFFVLQERLPNSSKAAVALSAFGIVLVFPSGLHMSGSVSGDFLLVGSSIGYTTFIVLGKKYDMSTLASSFALIVSMTVILAPLAAIAGGPLSLGTLVVPAEWESVVWLGVPCTVVALAMYTRGLSSIRATQSATLLLMEIMVGVALSVSLLGDVLSLSQVFGASVIAVAVILTSIR
jgi:drug/metabolite transporter (DMT)-like permease